MLFHRIFLQVIHDLKNLNLILRVATRALYQGIYNRLSFAVHLSSEIVFVKNSKVALRETKKQIKQTKNNYHLNYKLYLDLIILNITNDKRNFPIRFAALIFFLKPN